MKNTGIKIKPRIVAAIVATFVCCMLLTLFTSCGKDIPSPIINGTPKPEQLEDSKTPGPEETLSPEITPEPDKREALFGYWYSNEQEELIVIKGDLEHPKFIRYMEGDMWQADMEITNVEFIVSHIRYIWQVNEKTLTLYVGDAAHILRRVDEEDELHYENYFLATLNDTDQNVAVPKENQTVQMSLLADGDYEVTDYGTMTISDSQKAVILTLSNYGTITLECLNAFTEMSPGFEAYNIISNKYNGYIEVNKDNNKEIYISLTDLNNKSVINRTVCKFLN